jgi:hypothetical protein
VLEGQNFASRFGRAKAKQHKSGQKDTDDREHSDKDALLDSRGLYLSV